MEAEIDTSSGRWFELVVKDGNAEIEHGADRSRSYDEIYNISLKFFGPGRNVSIEEYYNGTLVGTKPIYTN